MPDNASARAAAIAGIDMAGYELIQAGTTDHDPRDRPHHRDP
ncbi:hypothetical protein [Curtobacterium sp. Curtsp57]